MWWFALVAADTREWLAYLWEAACVVCGDEDEKGKLHKCDKCDGPRFHDCCVSVVEKGECQWCCPIPSYVFSAEAVKKARVYAEGLQEGDRKLRALSHLEHHEKSVPPRSANGKLHHHKLEAVSSLTKVSVESRVDPSGSSSHSDKTTSVGQHDALDAQPSANKDDANSITLKTCANARFLLVNLSCTRGSWRTLEV
jgi:hypothetical protein